MAAAVKPAMVPRDSPTPLTIRTGTSSQTLSAGMYSRTPAAKMRAANTPAFLGPTLATHLPMNGLTIIEAMLNEPMTMPSCHSSPPRWTT